MNNIIFFLFSQRYLFELLSGLVCCYFLLKYLIFRNDIDIIFSLMTLVDNGGVYYETPSILRYAICGLVLLRIFEGFKINEKKYILLMLFLLYQIFTLSMNLSLIDGSSMRINIFQIICFIAVIGHGKVINIDLNKLIVPILFFGVGELVNISLNLGNPSDYLTYNTSKYIIAIPSLYYLCNEKYAKFTMIIGPTLYILVQYGSRMAMLIYLLSLVMVIILKYKISYRKILLIIGGISIMISFQNSILKDDISESALDSFKFGRLIYNIYDNSELGELVEKIDPVRTQEHNLFLDRPFLEVIFGSGMGVGVYDKFGRLSILGYSNTAFSNQELETKIFHRFHDVWIDLSLRFGVLFTMFTISYPIYLAIKSNRNQSISAFISFGLIFTAFYSYAGILIITVFILMAKHHFDETRNRV